MSNRKRVRTRSAPEPVVKASTHMRKMMLVIATAADVAGITPEELINRMDARLDEAGERLADASN